MIDAMTRTRDEVTSVAEAFAAARGRWPGIALDEATYRTHIAACSDEGEPPRHLEDLYLACALAEGDLAALAVFERDYLDHIPRIVGHMDQTGSLCDEVTQELRVRLLAADQDRRPRIADYTGRADLYSWFRVSVTRTAISASRKHRREQPTSDDALIHLGGAGADPAIAYLKATYREEFKAAFREAIAEL